MENGASSYRRFLDGDEDAFTDIVANYKDGLILYINGYVKNLITAEDLTEDTFFRLITKKPKFSGKSSFKTWLFAIGRNVAVDYIRRNARTAPVSALQLQQLESEQTTLLQAYITKKEKRSLHAAINELPADYRNVLWLLYFEEFSNKEAAVILGKNERQMRNLVYRAKKALRAKLEKEDFYSENN